jgi:SAM-dependent methyltransferase
MTGAVLCRFCGGESSYAFSTVDRNQRVSQEVFAYRRCTRCGTLSLANPPSDLGRYYPPSYYPPLPAPAELDREAEAHRWRLDLLLRHTDPGRLVEIGPSRGLFAHLAKRAGFDILAVEMDPKCAAYLREVIGVEVAESGDPASVLRELSGLRAITLWHALEHLPDPSAVLEQVARSLAPDGILVVATPNVDSVQYRVQGRRWPHVDAPRHLALIPRDALRTRLESLGLVLVELTSEDPAGEYDAFGWQGILPWRARGLMAHVVGRAVGTIARPLEGRGLRGSTYTAVYRLGP